MRKILLFVCLGFALTGCSTIEGILSPSPNVVGTLQASLATAEDTATGYIQAPPCGSTAAAGALICSTDSVVSRLVQYKETAQTAVDALRVNETASNLTSAQNAIDAYQAIVNSLPSTAATPTTNSATGS